LGIGTVLGQDSGKYPDPNDKAAMAEEMEIFLHQSDRFLDQSTSLRAVGCPTSLDEGFEGDTWPPAGWTVINAGDANTWSWFTGGAHTGDYMAGIKYSSTAHDDWLITPQIQPEVGNAEISFWAANYSASFPEQFNVKLSTTGTDQSDFTVTLASNVTPPVDYAQYTYDLTAYIGQPVYVAVQAISTNEYYLFLDDFLGPDLVYPATPYFTGGTDIAYGITYDEGVYEETYEISNCSSTADLTVSLDAADPELAVSGLPATIAAGGSATVTVTFTPSATGLYSGEFSMTTNDPDNPMVAVEVTSTVLETVVSEVLFEDFNSVSSFSLPANWTGNFSVRTSGGIDNSNRFTRNLYGTGANKFGQFTTNFIELPLNSKFLADYRIVDWTSYPSTPTPAENVDFTIYLSNDYGATFIPIYEYDETTHIESLDYFNVEIDLAAYIGETVMFAVAAEEFSGDFYLDFDNFGVQSAEPGIEIVNATLDMGDRPIGAWMKTAAFEIVNNPGEGDFLITEADIDEDFGGFLQVATPTLPYEIAAGETTFDFGVATTEAPITDGAFSGSFAMFFGGRAVLTADYSGNAYTPVAGDVWEMAFDANAITFPDNVAMGSFVDNYDLPGATDDGWDVVYMIDINAGDVVVDVSLSGTDAKMALYPSGFGGVGGPDIDNAIYEATTTATGVELFEGVYYLVVSTTGADFTLDITDMVMPAPDQVTYTYPLDQAIDIGNTDSLTWVFGENTLEYELVLGTTYPPATVVVPYTSDLATSYQLDNLNPNLQYFWQVNVRNNNDETDGEIWGFTTTIDSPADLTATVNDPGEASATVSATLEWTSPLDRALVGYNVYRDAVKINTDPVVGETFTDLGLARNTTFDYYVTAVFDEGESPASNTESITTQGVGTAAGVIYDFLTNDPIEGANVRVQGANGDYTMTTGADGAYSTLAYGGTYSITVTASGYTQSSMNGVVVTHNATTTNDFYMMETPLPVGDVTAFELSDDAVQISWDGSGPEPISEWLFYDDGTNVVNLGSASGTNWSIRWAIGFTPDQLAEFEESAITKVMTYGDIGYVANALTMKIWQGVDRDVLIYEYDALADVSFDGTWTEITLPVAVEFDNTEMLWIGFDGFADGGNYIAPAGNLAVPDAENFDGFSFNGGAWTSLSGLYGADVAWNIQAFVTNAYGATRALTVIEEEVPFKAGDQSAILDLAINDNPQATKLTKFDGNMRGIVDYTVWREKVYQPAALVEVGNTSQQNFVDFDWETMEWGVYRWAVTVNYEAGQTSPPTYSNTLDKDMETIVDVLVTLNSNESPGGTSVTFTNMSEPALELVYNVTLDNSGTFMWDDFRRGVYDIEVMLPGYAVVEEAGVEIFDDASFEWLLEEILAAPTALYVTPTAFATWEGGSGESPFVPMMESFDDLATGELPEGWTKSPETTNWGASLTDNAGGVSPEMRFNWSPSGTDEFYLMTPVMSTAGQDQLQLTFSHYINDFNGDYTLRVVTISDGVEYIVEEWLTPEDLDATVESYTLTAAHGVGGEEFQIAWVLDGYSYNINQWYIDDVMLNGPRAKAGRSFEVYKVFLDGQLVAEVEEEEYQYDVSMLTPYETYTAGVASVFSTGQSPTAEFDFIYVPCEDYAAPSAFTAAQVEGTLNIMLEWTNVDAAALDTIMALAIYRNGEEYELIDFEDGAVSTFLDENLEFGMYTYCVTYIYDSGAETCQGVTCSDEIEIDGNAAVDGMVMQAAYLGGDPIEGASVMLVNVDDPDIMFEFFTDATGAYEGSVIAGTYDYTVSAMGYASEMLEDVVIALNATVTNDFELMEFPFPPINVVAEEITDENVLITWHNPFYAPFEPIMETFDSGIPSDWTIVDGGSTADTWYMETPAGNGGSSLDGTPFAFADSDGAGIGSTMNEELITPVINASTAEELYIMFDQYYNYLGSGEFANVDVFDGTDWVTVLNQTADAGAWNNPNQQMLDVTAYANEMFQVRFHYNSPGWNWYWAVDNVAIVDEVTRSGAPVLTNVQDATRELFGYEVWRTTCETGDLEFLGLTLDTLFNDNTWGGTEAGVYKWGVRAVYEEDNYSEVVFSNCLDKDMITQVSVTVQTNSGDLADGTNVMFTNTSEPDLGLVYEVTLDETGYYMWEEFRKGVYDIYVAKNGFAPIEITDYLIDGPEDFVWTLEELLLPVSDLYVTPTGFATWSGGGVIPFEPFMDDFSEGIDNWTTEPATGNWQLSQTNLAGGVVPEVRFYWSPNTMNRFYFKSPVMSTLTQTELELSFDHFVDHFSGAYTISVVTIADGEEYTVEAWNPSADIPANNHVVTLTTDHGVGAEEFQIAFVFDGQAWNVNWWNIDNVMLYTPGTRELEYYKVWHEGLFITDTPETYYQYDIEGLGLVEGEEYLAEVAAVYSNGMSPKMSYVWTYYGCENFPGPENLAGSASGQDVTLTWGASAPPPPPGEDFFEDFEAGTLPTGWVTYDEDGDGYNWDNSAVEFDVFEAHSGLYCMTSASYRNDVGALTPDNWLVTPAIAVTADSELNFWVSAQDPAWSDEQYYVKVSTTGNAVADFTETIHDAVSPAAWGEVTLDLSAYAGETIYIAFQHADVTDMFFIKIDDVLVTNTSTRAAYTQAQPAGISSALSYKAVGNNSSAARQINSEKDPNADIRTVEMTREMWDLLYDFDMDTPSGLTGLAGAESDGEFIYATKWAGGEIVKFDMDGNFIETFIIPGVTGLRDLAFDGTYMYGAAAATTVYKMDFDAQTLVSSFTAPTAVRAIAYDADNNAFWGNNWSTDMVLFDESGATLNTLTGMPSMYGAAYDNFSEGGPFLWFFTGTTTGAGCQVEQYDIAAGAMTGVMHSVSADLGDVIAGGLYIVEDLVADKVILGGTAQGTPDLAFGYELIDNSGGGGGGGGGGIDPGVLLGANIYRDGVLIAEMVQDTFYVDPDVEYGMYTYCVTYVYESGAESCFGTCVDVEVAFPCDPPKELAGEYLWTEEAWGSMLEWNSPQDAIAEWLYYDDGTNVDGIGGPASFTWAIKFDPDQLADYAGASLTKIEIYNRTGATDELRIYEGTNAATLLHSQPLSGLGIEVYEQVDLTDPVLIDVTKELWIAVYTTDGLNYPAGCGPTQNEPNGDLLTLDGVLWEHLSDYALPYTWNLRGFVTTMAGATASLPMDKPVDDYSNNTEPLKVTGKPSAQFAAPASAAQADRELDVFNVYRSVDGGANELIASVPFEEGVTAYSYFDTDVEAQTLYKYQVSAFYTYTNGTCESDFAMALENPDDDFVTVFVTNTNEFGLNNTRVYPNPATNNVVIESAQMNRITVMNAVGQVVIDRGIEGEQRHDLNTSTYEAGVYMIRIETTEGVVTKRLTIVR
jgi:hypothetical protein